jgi:transcriptional regulator with XRE-family HTH domain
MKLEKYLLTHKISSAAFAKTLGVSVHAIRKWRCHTRIPRAGVLVKIAEATKGRVTARDWYNFK